MGQGGLKVRLGLGWTGIILGWAGVGDNLGIILGLAAAGDNLGKILGVMLKQSWDNLEDNIGINLG